MDIKDRWLRLCSSQETDIELICVGAWTLWNDRNNVLNNRSIPNNETCCIWVHEYLKEFQTANGNGGRSLLSIKKVQQVIQEGEELIMHKDATCAKDKRNIGIGVVIRDIQDNLKAVMINSSLTGTTPLTVEVVAVLERLRIASIIDMRRVTILSHSLSLILTIKKEVQCESNIATANWDIMQMRSTSHNVKFYLVNRQFNMFAHELAREGLFSSPQVWTSHYPDWISLLALQELQFFVPHGKLLIINESSRFVKRKNY